MNRRALMWARSALLVSLVVSMAVLLGASSLLLGSARNNAARAAHPNTSGYHRASIDARERRVETMHDENMARTAAILDALQRTAACGCEGGGE